MLRNTFIIAGLGMAGTIISSTFVAYGLSRFRIPYKGLILAIAAGDDHPAALRHPGPDVRIFTKIGWVGTMVPLTVPHFFANAYNVFLLRQFFLTIPRELDEAAAIDGAGPMRTLLTVILPQAKGAVLAVALFHFFYAWNDFLEPLVYLSVATDKLPISVGSVPVPRDLRHQHPARAGGGDHRDGGAVAGVRLPAASSSSAASTCPAR